MVLLFYARSVSTGNSFGLSCILNEELSYSKNKKLSLKEVFLCHLPTLDKCTPKQDILHEIANSMYGKRIPQLDPKPSTNYAAGESVLLEKAVLYL